MRGRIRQINLSDDAVKEILAAMDDLERQRVRRMVRGELKAPTWGVACERGIVATGIDFEEAVAIIRELDADGMTGLNIITADRHGKYHLPEAVRSAKTSRRAA